MNTESAQQALDALVAEYQRVIYDNNPLLEVILQIRFPTLLRLQSELPSDFQGKILSEYPHYEAQEAIELKVMTANAPPVVSESRVHIFLSNDRKWRVTLGSDSLSLSTRESYKDWYDFKGRAEFCIATFFEIYPIKVITRLGLRYRDLINPRKLGKTNSTWSTLINPSILGPMGAENFRAFPLDTAKWAQRFSVGDLKINMQGGTARQGEDRCYSLDFDISIAKEIIAGGGSLKSELELLHRPVGPLFRWAITDDLHAALGPKPPSDRSAGPQRKRRNARQR
jgi:uncharacterized protein (TIGR04255 family)